MNLNKDKIHVKYLLLANENNILCGLAKFHCFEFMTPHTHTHTYTHTTLTGLCYYRLSFFLLSSPFLPCFLLFFLFLFSLFSLLLEKQYVCLSVGFLNLVFLCYLFLKVYKIWKSQIFLSVS